jgi:predicted nucleotidyltransferase
VAICYDASVPSPSSALTLDLLTRLARGVTGLDLLLLFGSRARGDAHAGSDWDLGYLADERLDAGALLAEIVETIGSDRVDLVDLSRAGGLLRYRAARDGQVLFESRPRLAEAFQLETVDFWCDAAPVLQRGYQDVLDGLTP